MFVQVMSNKFTGEPAGYGFVNFDSDQGNIFLKQIINLVFKK